MTQIVDISQGAGMREGLKSIADALTPDPEKEMMAAYRQQAAQKISAETYRIQKENEARDRLAADAKRADYWTNNDPAVLGNRRSDIVYLGDPKQAQAIASSYALEPPVASPGVSFGNPNQGGNINSNPAPMGGGSVGGGLNPTARTLGSIIAGPESSGDYGVMYSPDPKNRRTFTDFSHHPNQAVPIPGTTDVSTAAGAYQFTHPTWTHAAQLAGVNDFTPASQDKAMWALAGELVPNLQGILESGDPRQIEAAMAKLGQTWKGIKDPGAATREYLTRRGQPQAPAPQAQAPQDSRYINTTGADNGFGYTGDQMLLDPRMERMLVGTGLGSAGQTFRGLAMGNNEAITKENLQQSGANTRQAMGDATRLQAENIQQAGADRRDANNPVSVGENSTVYLPDGHFASGNAQTDANGRHYIQGPGVGPDGTRRDTPTWVFDRQTGGERMVPQSEVMGNPNRYTHQQPGLLKEDDAHLATRISPSLGSDAGEIPPQVTQAIRAYAQNLYDSGQARSPDEAYTLATAAFQKKFRMSNDLGMDSVRTTDGKDVNLGNLGTDFQYPRVLMAPGSLAPPGQNQPAPPVQRPAGKAPAPQAQPQVPQGAALMEARQALARVQQQGGDVAAARATIESRLRAAGIDPRNLGN